MNKLYCPKCSYEIVPSAEDIEDMEVFCQNCLAYSKIIESNIAGECSLEFIEYEQRKL